MLYLLGVRGYKVCFDGRIISHRSACRWRCSLMLVDVSARIDRRLGEREMQKSKRLCMGVRLQC